MFAFVLVADIPFNAVIRREPHQRVQYPDWCRFCVATPKTGPVSGEQETCELRITQSQVVSQLHNTRQNEESQHDDCGILWNIMKVIDSHCLIFSTYPGAAWLVDVFGVLWSSSC